MWAVIAFLGPSILLGLQRRDERKGEERRGEEAKRWETSFKLWGRSWPSTRHPSTPSSFPPKTTTRFSSSPPFLNTSFFVVAVVAFIPSHVIVVRDSDLFSFPWSMPFCRFLMRDEFNWFGFFFFFLQSEYVSPRDKRREFVSGFTGSAGNNYFYFLFFPSYSIKVVSFGALNNGRIVVWPRTFLIHQLEKIEWKC